MSKEVTRRKFLKQSSAGSFVALTAPGQVSIGQIWEEVETADRSLQSPTSLSDVHRKLLRAAADEIIPAADGCPAATEAGAVEYVDALIGKVPELQKQLQAALTKLEAVTGTRSKQSFDQLNSAQRVRVLQAFEKESARAGAAESLYGAGGNLFALLRDLVYEGYYTSPKVWPQLGYEFHPTSRSIGPAMKPFDESILAEARKRPKSYREVK